MHATKPYAEACDRNAEPIFRVLEGTFTRPGLVLEIGSGTGQHAVYFSERFRRHTWQTSDRDEHHEGIRAWIADADLENVLPPLSLDVTQEPWPIDQADYVFTANTAHIMSWHGVEAMFRGVARVLLAGGAFCQYGPFNYGGRYTSPSNEAFDRFLRERDPLSGIRDLDDLVRIATPLGLKLEDDHTMPANNRVLVWTKL